MEGLCLHYHHSNHLTENQPNEMTDRWSLLLLLKLTYHLVWANSSIGNNLFSRHNLSHEDDFEE